jgi:hypothetical protein
LVVICGQQNYKLDTKHAIGRVVEEGTREGEVRGSISSNHVVLEKSPTCDFTDMWDGWAEASPNKNNFFAIFKICFMFPRNDLHWRFYYADRQ